MFKEAVTHLLSGVLHLTEAIRPADQVAALADRPIQEAALPHQDQEAAVGPAVEVLFAAEDDKKKYPCFIIFSHANYQTICVRNFQTLWI